MQALTTTQETLGQPASSAPESPVPNRRSRLDQLTSSAPDSTSGSVTPGRIARFTNTVIYYISCQCLRNSQNESPSTLQAQAAPSTYARISNYLPNSETFSSFNQHDSFVLYAIGSAITARNTSLNDGNCSKIRYVGVWMLAEATFLAAIPLAVVEAVVRSAIGSFLFIAKNLSPLGKETLESFYKNFRSNVPMQIIAGHIAYTQLVENFRVKTSLTSKSELIENDSMNHFLRMYHENFPAPESNSRSSTPNEEGPASGNS